MPSSPDESNQLQPSSGAKSVSNPKSASGFTPVIQQKPETVSVRAGSGVLTDIGDNSITRRAEHIRYSTDEEMVWQEAPSLVLLVPRFVKYAILMAIVLIACSVARRVVAGNPLARTALESAGIHAPSEVRSEPARRGHKPRGGHHAIDPSSDAATSDATSADAPSTDVSATDAAAVPSPDTDAPHGSPVRSFDSILALIKLFFGGLFTLLFLLYLLRLKTTRYSASSQRLIVEEGSLHSVNRPYELHQLGDAVILKPLLLRMFGVSNLIITNPPVELYGLRNAEYVRDILRQGGQLEAQRVDKIRWR